MAVPFDNGQPFRGVEFAWVERERLFVDDTYQRLHIRYAHVNKIVKNWTPDHFGALNVAPRHDGLFAIIDGQHRVLALDQMGIGPTTKIPCVVHTTSNEPITFVNLNRRAILDPMEEFRARLEGDEPDAKALHYAITKAGFEVGITHTISTTARRENTLYCIKRLEAIMQDGGPEALTELLVFIRSVWENDKDAYTSPVLGGVYAFRSIYRDLVTNDDVRTTLQRIGPRNLVREGRELEPTAGASVGLPIQISRVIRRHYMTQRLPDPLRIVRERARQARRQVNQPPEEEERNVT